VPGDFELTGRANPARRQVQSQKKDSANSLTKKTDLPTGPASADPRLLTTPHALENNSPRIAASNAALAVRSRPTA
jgi:hypothetical protein